ncbi:MAG TPA: cytochrome c, partial [Sphingobacteriaceae bacterium]|nr:cytochrome c [Sphingobacteriaceae bacterium]
YEREMALAEAAKQEWLAQSSNNIDESNVEVDNSPAVIEAGFAIYTQNCAVCHGAVGEGGIGPNMADDYWIHGGEIEDIFRIVKYGVIDKGMIPWEQSLTPMQIAEVSNYILTLRGTNPPDAKEPQGDKVEYRTGDRQAAPVEEQPEPDVEKSAPELELQQG